MDQILMHYLQVSQHMSQQFRNHFGKLNLTFPQALALNILGSEGPMPISRLAERTGSANSTISGIVDRLERLELARRTRSELDHRVIYVEAYWARWTLRSVPASPGDWSCWTGLSPTRRSKPEGLQKRQTGALWA